MEHFRNYLEIIQFKQFIMLAKMQEMGKSIMYLQITVIILSKDLGEVSVGD